MKKIEVNLAAKNLADPRYRKKVVKDKRKFDKKKSRQFKISF